ncbi:MAG TPA: tetratricopeptide repeat protein [Nitrospiria bacterium]|jgi:tetratricopeptide (TPR) repeat protein|nr:tetratricopeptide repeat protein [Nitrospiria bacterium]
MKNEDKQRGFLSPEILKLSERLAEDPTSKLFMPLGEEYFKAGMLEEAVMVLMDGLKAHPGFTSAHVTLGKVYLEKGQFKEAKEQFETAIQSSPDNLLAHRKLVKIYSEEGAIQKAIQSCRVILSSDPKDEEIKKALAELGARQRDIATAQNLQPELVRTQHADLTRDTSSPVLEEKPEQAEEHNSIPTKEKGMEYAIELEEEKQEVIASPTSEEREKGRVIELEDDEGSFEEIMNLMGQRGKIEPAAKATEEELATESLAELYMKQGFYNKGAEIYQALVSKDPKNETLLKKLKDAVTLSKNASKTPVESNEAKAERPASMEIPNTTGPAVVTEEAHAEARSKPEAPHSSTPFKPSPAQWSKAEKIQKLQAWLEQVKRSQKQ